MKLNEQLINEAQIIVEASLEDIQTELSKVRSLVNRTPMLAPLAGPVDRLNSQVLEVLAQGDMKNYLDQLKKGKGLGFFKNLFQSPKGKLFAQAQMVLEVLKSIENAWKRIAPLYKDLRPSSKDFENTKKILGNAVNGGAFKKLSGVFKTEPFPGLSPENILSVVLKPIEDFLNASAQDLEVLLDDENRMRALENFKKGMEELSSTVDEKQKSELEKLVKQSVSTETDFEETKRNLEDAFGGSLTDKQIELLFSKIKEKGLKVTK